MIYAVCSSLPQFHTGCIYCSLPLFQGIMLAIFSIVISVYTTGIDSRCITLKPSPESDATGENGAGDGEISYGYGFFHLVFFTGEQCTAHASLPVRTCCYPLELLGSFSLLKFSETCFVWTNIPAVLFVHRLGLHGHAVSWLEPNKYTYRVEHRFRVVFCLGENEPPVDFGSSLSVDHDRLICLAWSRLRELSCLNTKK